MTLQQSFSKFIPTRPIRFAAKLLIVFFVLSQTALAFQRTKSPAPTGLLTRTTSRREACRLGYGSTITIVGAPIGSITIEGWPRSEVEVVAEIEQQAETEDDLNRLAALNGFIFDSDSNHVSILSTGTHDKSLLRRVAKDFPKRLLGLPWKIDYVVRVPANSDLEINGGRGAIKVSGVEGAIRLSAAESETNLTLTGGTVSATVAIGNVLLSIPVRSWRGSGAEVRVAAGSLVIEVPPGFNGDVDADILRAGKIEDAYGAFESRQKGGLTPTAIRARAGSGGPFFKFTVGDGTVVFRKTSN
jgi:hypothetical protein